MDTPKKGRGSGDMYDPPRSPRKVLRSSRAANVQIKKNFSSDINNSTLTQNNTFTNEVSAPYDHDNDNDGKNVSLNSLDDYAMSQNGGDSNVNELNNSVYFTPKLSPPLKRSRHRPMQSLSEFREIHDLTKLDCITLENVLECLRERYKSNQYYTYAGPILLSLNSCQRVPRSSLVEDVARMTFYFLDDSNKSNIQKENEELNMSKKPPHVYDIGQQCLKNLVTVGSHQIVLISGESGAGKTTATQQLIKYLTENNSRNFGANICSNLDKKIYYATLLMEAFGNAKTQQNPNSSRFGRLVQLNYEQRSGRICGAEIQTYLLEKHRVAKYDNRCERSFHIFYYILIGLKNGTLRVPNNVAWSAFKEFTPSHLIEEALECEEDEVQRLQNAIQAFNLDRDFSELVSILIAIISLLSFTFVPDCDSSSEDEYYSSSKESISRTEFTVADWNSAKLAADLLGIANSELVDILVARKITAGNGTSRRQSIFRKPCERAVDCEERLHAFTSFIYDRVFSYILDTLNTNLKGDYGAAESHVTLSLLDLYGFENFNINHLEQVCINYANERLQQINVSIMKSYYEQSASDQEGFIPPTELNKIEDELSCRMDELHSSIFSFFDEECLLKRDSEDKDILERMRINLAARKSKFIRTGRLHETEFKFTVSHYAATVDYKLSGMVQKNKDHIPPEFQDILRSSNKSFVHALFKQDLIQGRNGSGTPSRSIFTISGNKNSRGKTILTRFKISVEELMSRLKSTENNDIHFIRCIKPNADLLAGTFSMNLVEKQLHACGISDVVKIAGNGYPIRIHSTRFVREFPKVISHFCNGSLDPKLLWMVFSYRADTKSIKFGKNIVLMSEKCWKTLKKTEHFLVLRSTRIIQRAWKKFLQRKELSKLSSTQKISCDSSMTGNSPNVDDNKSHSGLLDLDDRSFNSGSLILDESSQQALKSPRRVRWSRMLKPMVYLGNGIASKSPVHTLPIKLYMKKSCLPFAEKPPRRLLANGIQDAFEDYGIIFYRTKMSQLV